MRATLHHLEQTIRQRRTADPTVSYVAKLAAKGRAKIAQKVGEEAVETVIAAMADDRAGAVGESADLLFHLNFSSFVASETTLCVRPPLHLSFVVVVHQVGIDGLHLGTLGPHLALIQKW